MKVFECKIYIYRDGKQFVLDEDYLEPRDCTEGGSQFLEEGRSLKIPEGHYVVMGDNRSNSLDSRFFGLVDRSEIVGEGCIPFLASEQSGIYKLDVDNNLTI
ncbi:MAG: hypothetical protein KatS3mg101_0257 [Patescibacteria group bacterium]|nr:MAG: hypothetical protein KatS3mg101_0257 [Patescibacteria group bacterium]